jgi:20S proteasome alpha/beta subunit
MDTEALVKSITEQLWLNGMGSRKSGPIFAANLVNQLVNGGWLTDPAEPPLVLIHVDGGIAEEWYTVEGTGKPVVSILDFDREDESDESRKDWIDVARETLAAFKARGIDTSDLDRDVNDMVVPDEEND